METVAERTSRDIIEEHVSRTSFILITCTPSTHRRNRNTSSLSDYRGSNDQAFHLSFEHFWIGVGEYTTWSRNARHPFLTVVEDDGDYDVECAVGGRICVWVWC